MKVTPRTPLVSLELVEWLEYFFRDSYPEQPESHDAYSAHVGEQRVIRRLRRVMEEQSRNVLENP